MLTKPVNHPDQARDSVSDVDERSHAQWPSPQLPAVETLQNTKSIFED